MVNEWQILGIHIDKYFNKQSRLFLTRLIGHISNDDISFNLVFDEMVDNRVDIGFKLD